MLIDYNFFLMLLFPKKPNYNKSFSNKKVIKNNNNKPVKNRFGPFAIFTCENSKITNFQLEAIRRFLRRFLKKKVQIFFRVFPSFPITKKPNDVRLGRGKGILKYWTCISKKGIILIELRGFSGNFHQIKNTLKSANIKITAKTNVHNQRIRWIL